MALSKSRPCRKRGRIDFIYRKCQRVGAPCHPQLHGDLQLAAATGERLCCGHALHPTEAQPKEFNAS
jgi:hypothetical protein